MNKIIFSKGKKANDFSCFCNNKNGLTSILTKPKKSQLGNTMATFIATIVIIIILLGYVIISGAVKAVSGKNSVKVVNEGEVGVGDINNYLNNGFSKVIQLKFSYGQNRDISKAIAEVGYP